MEHNFWEVVTGFIILSPLIVVVLLAIWIKLYLVYVFMVTMIAGGPTNNEERTVTMKVRDYDMDEDY